MFDGFDTHAEVSAELEHHIEAANSIRRADELKAGDWVAELIGDLWDQPVAAKVEFVRPYTDSVANDRVFVVASSPDGGSPKAVRLLADQPVRLLTDAERAAMREQAERAEFIAGLHEFADWLAANPWAPIKRTSGFRQHARFQVDLHGPGEIGADADLATVVQVRGIAARLGVKVDESLSDRTDASITIGGVDYSVIAWHKNGRPGLPKLVAADPDPTGLNYQREQDDPTPVSPARGGPVHTGGVVDGGQLVDETEHGERVEVGADGCGCPITEEVRPNSTNIDGTERTEHRPGCWNVAPVGETPPCYVANGFQAPEVIAEREAACAARHPGQVCLLPSGLTRAADQSRGPLAGTTPVVAYFSFGHGQTDPDSGQKLIDHYVTVVAPTYEECREAMFSSRFGNRWSWDYLAGRAKTTEAVSGWTEHEVIVADGTDQELAKSALKAAGDLLYGVPVSEARWHECEDPAGCGRPGGHQAPEPTFPDQPVGGR